MANLARLTAAPEPGIVLLCAESGEGTRRDERFDCRYWESHEARPVLV